MPATRCESCSNWMVVSAAALRSDREVLCARCRVASDREVAKAEADKAARLDRIAGGVEGQDRASVLSRLGLTEDETEG